VIGVTYQQRVYISPGQFGARVGAARLVQGVPVLRQIQVFDCNLGTTNHTANSDAGCAIAKLAFR
jgi:hypothetical protein